MKNNRVEYIEAPTPYGRLTSPPEVPKNLHDYAKSLAWRGLAHDPTGYIWIGARMYDPNFGRFLTPDPYHFPFCLDLYSFANCDPINFHDHNGRFSSLAYKTLYSEPNLDPELQSLYCDSFDGDSIRLVPLCDLTASFAFKNPALNLAKGACHSALMANTDMFLFLAEKTVFHGCYMDPELYDGAIPVDVFLNQASDDLSRNVGGIRANIDQRVISILNLDTTDPWYKSGYSLNDQFIPLATLGLGFYKNAFNLYKYRYQIYDAWKSALKELRHVNIFKRWNATPDFALAGIGRYDVDVLSPHKFSLAMFKSAEPNKYNYREHALRIKKLTPDHPSAKLYHAHHLLPQEFIYEFNKFGIKNIHEYAYPIPIEVHKEIHKKGYNHFWGEKLGEKPTKEKIHAAIIEWYTDNGYQDVAKELTSFLKDK